MNIKIDQIYSNLPTGFSKDTIQITQEDNNTIYCKAIRFGKYEEKFTVSKTKTGRIKKNSVRFYE